MRLNPILTILAAVVAAAILLGAAWVALQPSGPLIESAEFSLSTITPNADGAEDVTRITYRLRRPATVSIYFLNAQGRRFDFRTENLRDSGEHTLLFSGIVEGFVLRNEWDISGTILKRVLLDGNYTWVIAATGDDGQTVEAKGTLNVEAADSVLPDLSNFTASPSIFTPNQDGLSDRVAINVWLTKDIPDDGLRVTLIDANGNEYPIPPAEAGSANQPGRAGLHAYDYDGGIDNGGNPPPDGTYTLRAEAEDAIGQKVMTETTLAIKNGGRPFAEIYQGDVKFSSTTIVLGQTLYFTVTVENYGASPIRTFGPWSGTVYEQSENSNTLGFYEEDGAWRLGIDCDSCIRDYPWRWGLGTPETLTPIPDESGRIHYYLMPNQRAVVTGGVTLTEVIDRRNPQNFWAGLIHEAVEISTINNRVDPRLITIEKP
jgi:hypothetical protein